MSESKSEVGREVGLWSWVGREGCGAKTLTSGHLGHWAQPLAQGCGAVHQSTQTVV